MNTDLKFATAQSVPTEMLAVFAVQSDKEGEAATLLTDNAALRSAAETALNSGEFEGTECDTLLLHSPRGLAAKRLLIVGVGKVGKLDAHQARKAAGAAVRAAKPRHIHSIAIALPQHVQLPSDLTARAVVEGAFVGDFDPDTYRSDRKDKSMKSVVFVAAENAERGAIERGYSEGLILGEAQNFTRSLVNEPGNRLTPTVLGARAKESCESVGIKCEVYGAEKLHELKMGAFWSVSQGSAEPPALIVMTYEPSQPPAGHAPVLGLVGKGITFDTGGISIKPSEGMEKMKYDMAGGAAMIGAMRAIAQLKPAVKVISIVCASENMPSGTAQKPGDIQVAASGKTIEIMNTDAEGRLVLAAGLWYAKQLGATHLIDAATLTGACVVALGMVNAGVFSNDEDTFAHFHKALERSGEKFWRLPCTDDYKEDIKSSIADIMNTGKGRWGGAITAAMFLKEFAEDTPWIHLDIAGVAWTEEAKPWMAKGPSGIAVRSIVEWVRSYSNQ